ncbi:hypothetical protein LRP88_14401 [Fusarium phalaenopsidis]
MKLLNTLLTALGASLCCARTLQIRGGRPFDVIQSPHERDVLQDIVTWDEHSLFINGERVTIFSAEIHPFRLPVPSLYLDLFQKVKAAGFNMVSFYVDWALLEGKPGEFSYMEHICSIIAKAQIINGGPVILFQPENEYSAGDGVPFPSHEYLKYVNDQARNAGIVVPLINNDAWQGGTGAPGSGIGAVDIYFQGGAFDPPGGGGFENCYILTNHEFARVFYKNNLAAGTFGGTNWGNLGHCDGYTSYDYGAAIKEDRSIDREKYSEIKLQGQFLRVSPSYATATPGNLSTSRYTDNEEIAVTPLTTEKEGSFFVVRHTDFTSTESSSYKLKVPTSAGTLTVPQLGGSLSLNGRDSKIHVADYAVGEHTLLYSTAEVLTWKKFGDKAVLILYGGPDELHEVAIKGKSAFKVIEGSGVKSDTKKNAAVLQWKTSSSRRVVQRDSLFIYLLDRNSAYKYWVPDLPGKGDRAAYGTSVMNPDSVIINGPQLVRSISVQGSKLSVQADFNVSSTPLEIIGAPKGVSKLVLNGKELQYQKSKLGNWIAQRDVKLPAIKELDLSSLDWNYVDSLPEIKKDYNDGKWTVADKTTTNNTRVPLQNTVSLYGSDYGFHAGALIYRGHFTADGSETQLKLWTQGGRAFATAAWLDDKFLGSFTGNGATGNFNSTYELPKLQKGKRYVVTVVVDNTGLNGNWTPGYDEQKSPRGILDWALMSKSGRKTPIAKWKLTGNLGGEDYVDKFRGPLNEGGFYFERQGYHLPSPPLKRFKKGSPFKGIDKAGVAFYTAKLGLDYPSGQFGIPLSFTFKNTTDSGPYRALLFVNGFQFGRYVSSIGPQTVFPVPEGVLNYHGDNWIGVSIWALEEKGAKLPGLRLTAGAPVQTGRQPIKVVQGPKYSQRSGAY